MSTESKQQKIWQKLGQDFSVARQNLGLSLEMVTSDLNLKKSILENFEKGSWQLLPEQVFVQGYLRSYAQHLKLDAEVILEQYKLSLQEEESVVEEVLELNVKVSNSWIKYGIVALVILSLVLLFTWFNTSDSTDSSIEVTAPDALLGKSSEPSEPSKSTVKLTDSVIQAPSPVFKEEQAIVKTDAHLQMAFDAECWVEVTDGQGNVLITSVRGPDNAIDVKGVAPLRIIIGEQSAVTSVRYNGQPVTFKRSIHSTVARLTLPKNNHLNR